MKVQQAVHAPVHLESAFAGGPHIMGVVNVTPDSFSDGGKFLNHDKAIEHGLQLISDGARVLDIGGESTRPGAEPIDSKEEIARIIPVIKALAGKAKFISIDTRNSKTMEAAIAAGANAVNDISGLRNDIHSADVIAEAGAHVFLMHMQGEPPTMQKNPAYTNVVEEIFQFLKERIQYCETRRIAPQMIICDPGIGFGKTLEHNLLLLGNISRFHDLDAPIMLGASRKAFIGKLSKDEPPDERLPGSLAAALWGLSQGVQVYRVHDVKETRQAFAVYNQISNSASPA